MKIRGRAAALLTAVMLAAGLLVGGGAVSASAAPPDPVAQVTALAPGETLVLGSAVVTRTSHGLSVRALAPPAFGMDATFCGVALAAAIVGIGAGVLGVIAAATGSGTVVIAGYLLTGAQVGILAGLSGSYAALLGWISHNIC